MALSDPRNHFWNPATLVWAAVAATNEDPKVEENLRERAMIATKMLLQYKPLDQCLGSVGLEASLLSLMPIFGSEQCRATASGYFGTSLDLKQFVERTKFFAQHMQGDFVSYFKYLSSIERHRYEDFCDAYEDKVMPCIANGIIPAILQLLHRSDKCCQPLFDAVPDIGAMINDAVRGVGNVACATYDGTQRCGHRFIQSFMSNNWARNLFDLAFLLETPNDQGCAAFTAQEYTVASGKYHPKLGTVETSWDSCAVYWDELWTSFQKFSIKQPLQSLFEPESCITSKEVEPYVPAGMIDIFRNFLSGRCFHLPNSFSKSCKFHKNSVPLKRLLKSDMSVNYSKLLDKTLFKLLASKIKLT